MLYIEKKARGRNRGRLKRKKYQREKITKKALEKKIKIAKRKIKAKENKRINKNGRNYGYKR